MRTRVALSRIRDDRGQPLVFLILVLLGSFALRVYRLDVPSLRGDEAFSILFARNSLDEMLRLFAASTEPHPPFSFMVLHYWAMWAGESEFALRFTSLGAGVVAVALVYVLGRTLWGRQVGLVAAALVALNPFYIWHAQEARMYAMLLAFSIASVLLFMKVLGRDEWIWWVAYGLVTALSVYTHYYAFWVIVFEGLWVFVGFSPSRGRTGDGKGNRHLEKGPLGRWAAGLALAGLLYAPWLFSSWDIMTAYRGGARSDLPFLEPVYRYVLVYGQGQTLPRRAALWFLPLWGGLFLAGVLVAWHRGRRSAAFTSLYLLVPWIAIFIDSLRRPAFDERYFMVSSPPYYLFIALALVALCRWRRVPKLGSWIGVGIAFTIVGVCGASLYNHYHNTAYARAPDWRALNDFYVEHTRSGDAVIANYPDPAVRYYYRFGVPWMVLPEAYPVDAEATEAVLEELASGYSRIWLTPQRWPFWDDKGLVQSWLDTNAERVNEYQVDKFQILLYHTFDQYEKEVVPLDARFEGGIQLLGYALRDGEGRAVDQVLVKRGGKVRLTLYWQAESRVDRDYVVFTHLLDATGWLRGQQDNQPRQGTFPTRAWTPGDWVVDVYRIPVTADAPVGDGLLEVGMYDPSDGQRLQVSGQDADPGNRRVLLRGVVRIH